MDEIIFILLFVLLAFGVLIMTFAVFTGIASFRTGGAVFTTTHHSKIKKILENIPMHSGQIVYDLGCGDGRFLIEAAKQYKVKAIGFEINPWAFVLGRIRVLLQRANVSIRFQNFWKADLSDADIVFFYLFPDVIEKLKEKLSAELKGEAKVISCNFEVPGWKAEKILRASHSIHTDPIFIYSNSHNKK